MYLFSLNPRIFEVIIRKNAEPGWNNEQDNGGKDVVVYSDVTGLKKGGDVIPDSGRSREKVFPVPFSPQTKLRPAVEMVTDGETE